MNASPEWITSAPREEQEKVGKIRMFPSGRYVNPFDVNPEDIEIGDIAHHLSLICRYTGGVPFFYGVAQHSVLVSEYLMKPEERLAGLLHDASEAYLSDIASPMKRHDSFNFYREREDILLIQIFAKFGVDPYLIPKIKPFDDLMFERESATFFGNLSGPKRITSMSPAEARHKFLTVFRELRPTLAPTVLVDEKELNVTTLPSFVYSGTP